jgi:hypothetical protein
MRLLLTVPAAQQENVTRSLLELHAATAVASAAATRAYLGGDGPAAALLEARDALNELDELVDQLGWTPPPRAVMTEISAERELLSAAVGGALSAALERAARACARYERGVCDVDEIAARVRGAGELVELFAQTELVERRGQAP